VRGLGFRPRDASQIKATELTRIDVCWSLAFGLALTDNVRGAAFQARNLVLALRSGERYRVARAVAIEAGYTSRGAGGRFAARRRSCSARTRSRTRAERRTRSAGAHGASGMAYYLAGRYRPALEHMERATKVWSEVLGTVWELDSMSCFSTMCLVQLGEIGRVARETPIAVRDARQRGDLLRGGQPAHRPRQHGVARARRCRRRARQIDEAMSEWSKQGFHLEHYYELLARTNALVYAGRAREAYAHITARWSAFQRSFIPLTIQAIHIFLAARPRPRRHRGGRRGEGRPREPPRGRRKGGATNRAGADGLGDAEGKGCSRAGIGQ